MMPKHIIENDGYVSYSLNGSVKRVVPSTVNGRWHGEYFTNRCHHNRRRSYKHTFFLNGGYHGEYKIYNSDKELIEHQYYNDGELIYDFIEQPALYPKTEKEKLAITLRYGAPFITNNYL